MGPREVEELWPVVLAIAHSIHRTLPQGVAALEDLVSEGWVGALSAAPRYSPEMGATLAQWCRRRIEGAMRDLLRHQSPGGRTQRKRPTLTSLEAAVEDEAPIVVADRSALKAFLDVDNTEQLQRIWYWRSAVGSVPQRHRRILRAYFFEGKDTVLIAKRRGITPGRVSQIIHTALKNLCQRAEDIEERSKPRCPCGNPLWYERKDGRMRRRPTYCSRACFNRYQRKRVETCQHPGCTTPSVSSKGTATYSALCAKHESRRKALIMRKYRQRKKLRAALAAEFAPREHIRPIEVPLALS